MKRMGIARRCCQIAAIVSVVLLIALSMAGNRSRLALAVISVVMVSALIADAVLMHRIRKQVRAAQRSAPRRSVLATVMKKRTTYSFIGHTSKGSFGSSRDAWFVTFRTAQNEVLEFETPFDVYQSVSEGMTGRLRCQGSRFIAFKAQATQKQEDEVRC